MRESQEETHYRVEAFENGDWQYVGCASCLWNSDKKARYYRNRHDVMTRVVRVHYTYEPKVEREIARIHTTNHHGDDHARACDLRVLLNAVCDMLERENSVLVSMDVKDMPVGSDDA